MVDDKLCSSAVSEYEYYGGLRFTSEYDACRGEEGSCYVDYYDSLEVIEWWATMFKCSWSAIGECTTTDYQSYCTSNPGWKCYISRSITDYHEYRYLIHVGYCSNVVPAMFACWAYRDTPSREYQNSYRYSVSYLKCN